jgi:signal peptidase
MRDRLASIDRRHVVNAVGVLLLVFVVVPFLAFAVPQAIGAEQSYVVMSGSMSPAIGTGDVIFVYDTEPEAIEEGDIITFDQDDREQSVTTHRVVDVTTEDGSRAFVTQGDANEEPDPVPVPAENVIGVVPQPYGHALSIPYMGRLLLFMQTQQGILLLVFVPAGLLVVTEILSLYREAKSGGSSETTSGETPDDPAPKAAAREED